MPHRQDINSHSSPFRPPPQSPYVFPGPIIPSSAAAHQPSPMLHRNQSVSEAAALSSASSGGGGLRRSRSFSSSDHPNLPPPAASRSHLRFFMDDAIHELLGHHHHHHRKQQSRRTAGGAFAVLTSLFSCWNPCRKAAAASAPSDDGGVSASRRISELLEISRKQQSELADKQDTIDMLEWQLEQLQAMALSGAAGDLRCEHIRRSSGGVEAALAVLHEQDVSCSADLSNSMVDQGSDDEDDCSSNGGEEGDTEEERRHGHGGVGAIDHSRLLPPKLEERENKAIGGRGRQQKERRSGEIACPAKSDGGGGDEKSNGGELLLFEMAAVRARYSIRYFCKALIKQMEASGLAVLAALGELEPGATYARKEHVVYALEARISRAFFHCFENDSFDDTGITQILDPAARCEARRREFQKMKASEASEVVNAAHPSFNAAFRRFCQRKTKEMWAQLSWSVDFEGEEEKEVFTTAFLEAAKGVWLLHRLAFSMNPSVAVLRVASGMPIDPQYVDAVAAAIDDVAALFPQAVVSFLIMPGFQTPDKVIVKCQVYPQLRQCCSNGAKLAKS